MRQWDADADDQLVGGERRPAIGREEGGRRDGALAANPAHHDLGVERQEHGQAVARRRGGGEVAAEGAAVLDLGRSDLGGHLGEHRGVLRHEVIAAQLRVRGGGAKDERFVRHPDAAQLAEGPDVEVAALVGDPGHPLDKGVGAAGDRPPAAVGKQGVGRGQRGG